MSRQDGEACAKRLQALFIECSAKTKAGIEQTFEELVQKVCSDAARGRALTLRPLTPRRGGWMQARRASLADAGYAQPLAEDAKEAGRRGAHRRQHRRRRRRRRLVLRMLKSMYQVMPPFFCTGRARYVPPFLHNWHERGPCEGMHVRPHTLGSASLAPLELDTSATLFPAAVMPATVQHSLAVISLGCGTGFFPDASNVRSSASRACATPRAHARCRRMWIRHIAVRRISCQRGFSTRRPI